MRMKVLFASLLLAASGQVLAQSSGQVGGLYPWWQEIYSKIDFSSIADNKKSPDRYVVACRDLFLYK